MSRKIAKYQRFESWEKAREFMTELGPENVISVYEGHGAFACLYVWYWGSI